MDNTQKYNHVFMESFSINEDMLNSDLLYNTIEAWDSVGHMSLIATLEDAFDIMLEMDDIVDFSSYERGFEILAKYGIQF